MARRTKSLKDIEKQRLRISRALSERAINASQSDFYNLQKRNARTNRIAKRYSENIQKANNWSYMPNSFYGDPEKINKQVAQRTYMGRANG